MERSAAAIEHEDGLARFIAPGWRDRFRDGLASKRRQKILVKLDHFRHLDARFLTPIPTARQTSEWLGPELRRRGAPERVYVVSQDDDLDSTEMPLADALRVIVDGDRYSAFISCVPGKLAYFHEEEYDNRYILQRRD
jgi:hypothetical protein